METIISKKVCLLGDFAVGKTSLIRRFVYSSFEDKYISTIGVKVSRKTVTMPLGDEIVQLAMMLWDLAGREEFDRVRHSYLRGAAGAVLVCDLTRPATLEGLSAYVEELSVINPAARLVLAANKSDLLDQFSSATRACLLPEQVAEVAVSLGVLCFFTSAKSGENVEELFRELAGLLLKAT
jgi:small GTP-binding protein